jgi:hypothetical protein
MVSFTPLLLYLQGKILQYPLDMRMGGHRAGLDAMEKRKIFP